MAGIHGKNVELRLATSQTLISNLQLGETGTGIAETLGGISQIFRAQSSTQRDWKYDRSNTLITFDDDGTTTTINTQTRLINYAGGAIWLGQYPNASGVIATTVVSMDLTTVASLKGDARNFSVSVTADTADTTTIGETWATFVEGLAKFEGSLDGLYVDDYWYQQAVATISGVIPERVLRFKPNPATANTYYQGTVIFPTWELSGGYDSVIEHSVPFQGRGPLDYINAGNPHIQI